MATFNINEVARRIQYTVGSSGRAGPYNFSFQVNAASELQVYQNDTLLTDSVQYNATVSGTDGTGSITFIDNSGSGGTNYTPAQNDIITIIGDQPLSRTTVFQTGSANNPVTLETEFDNVVIRQQQLKEMMDRSIQLKPTTQRTVTGSGTSGPLQFPYDPTPSNNADKVIAFDSNGTSLQLGPTTANLNTLATLTTEIAALGPIASDITNVSNIGSSNITAVAGKATEIGLLGNADVIADMALLGNADVIADMALLATTDVISDLNTLATSDIVSDLNQLATTDFVSDLNAVEGIKANITTAANNITGINSFAERYRVGSSDPSTSLDSGDLNFNTSSNELKYYDGNQWQTVASQDQNVKVSANDTSASVLNSKIAVAGGLTKTITNPGSNETLTLTAQAAEVYGFELVDTDSDGITETLRVHTTNGGADNISSTTYAGFDDVIYGASGMSWSLETNGELRVTI